MANPNQPETENKQILREMIDLLGSDSTQLSNGMYLQILMRCLFTRTQPAPARRPKRDAPAGWRHP